MNQERGTDRTLNYKKPMKSDKIGHVQMNPDVKLLLKV